MNDLKEKLKIIRKKLSIVETLWGYFPLTIPGLLLGVMGYGLYTKYAVGRNDYVLLVLSCGMALVLAFSFVQLLVAVTLFFIQKRQMVFPDILAVTDEVFLSGVSFGHFFSFPSLEWIVEWSGRPEVTVQIQKEGGQWMEKVLVHRRLLATQIQRVIRFVDVLGLVKFRFQWTKTQKARVEPAVGHLPPPHILKLFASGEDLSHPDGKPEGDLIEMRAYVPGDPIKRILWKVYAKNRQLLIRMPERSIAMKKKTYAYLVTGSQDEAAASTALLMVRKGFLGTDFVFATDGNTTTTNSVTEVTDRIVQSSMATLSGDFLENFFQNPETHQANCILFVPPQKGPWLDSFIPQVQKLRKNVQVLICMDGAPEEAPLLSWKKFLLQDSHDHAGEARELAGLLQNEGIQTMVIDRKEGRVCSI